MDLFRLLKCCFYWLATVVGTGNIPVGFDGDVLDVIAGTTFLVKTWADNRHLKSISVSKDNAIRLNAIFIKSNLSISKDQYDVIMLQYINTTTDMSLILDNCGKKDEGIYYVDEIVADASPNNFEREDGKWKFKLNVIDQTANAFIGQNVTIDWFYSQQAINRTLRIIHSNNEIIMNLPSNNKPQIVPAFRNRLLYSGDVSRGYMSFTLLNIEKSDSGVFKIETIHRTTVSGSKHLIVEGDPHTANEVTESTPALAKGTTTDSRSTIGPSLVPSSEIMDTEKYTTSPSLLGRLTSENPISTSRLLVDVKYVVVGAMGLMIMMIGCFIWIQRSNRHSLKAVQRMVLETSSSTLNYAPTSKRNQLPTSIVDKEGLCQLIISTPVGKSQSVLKFLSNPDNSLSFDTPSSFAMSVPILADDKPGFTCKNIVASKESNTISIQTLSYARDNTMLGLLEDCPTACILGSAASNAVVDLSQPDHYPYAKVKKGPKSTSTNNDQFAFSAVPDGECSDGYKMVNFILGNEPTSTFQNLEIVSESTIQGNVSLQETDDTRKNYVRDSKNDDGYETCGNIKHMTLIEHVKVSEVEGAMTGKDQEPNNCMIPRCAMHSDYADTEI